MNLDADSLRALIAEGEGVRLEFKRGLPRPERLARTLCAFANTRGGLLVVGVEDNGRPYGVPRPTEVLAELRRVAAEAIGASDRHGTLTHGRPVTFVLLSADPLEDISNIRSVRAVWKNAERFDRAAYRTPVVRNLRPLG